MEWDVFISHASVDKENLVRPLAAALAERGLRVWYDEHSLKVGDSIRRGIEQGLTHSRYGIVVLSKDFLKEWPQKELDFLFASESDGELRILPVWHEVSLGDVREVFPLLADRVAANTSLGLEAVVNDLIRVINPHLIDDHSNQRKEADPNHKIPKDVTQRINDHLIEFTELDTESKLLASYRILVVDDDHGMGRTLKHWFGTMNVDVDVAYDGLDALQHMKDRHYEFVLSDIRMPKMDGMEMIAIMNERYPETPIIVMSGAIANFEDIDYLPYVVALSKPFDPEELSSLAYDVVHAEGLHSLIKNECSSVYPSLYKLLVECRWITHKFLESYKSNELFESALRHKLKETIGDFCRALQEGWPPIDHAWQLRTKLQRLRFFMQQIDLGAKTGLTKLVKGVVEDVESEHPAIKVDTTRVHPLPPSVSGTNAEKLLAFCLLEFIDNAVDVIQSEGELRITIRQKQTRNSLFLSVSNNGPQIPENLAVRIFEESVTTKGKGRGMGLFIIKRLADRFQGRVWLNQENGVQFAVEVPMV